MKKQDRGPAAHAAGPWERTAGNFVYALGLDNEGHVVNRMHLAVYGGWADGARTSSEEINATAQLIAAAPELADAVADLLSVMEMQEKRESGEFHITGEVAFGIWSDAKARATAVLRAAGRLATAGSASASLPPADSEKEGAP